ncbi:hypothetical protein CEXT_182541 [Caerostris extrusa]|uniref:Uncharacterized protein n=1 Tax=Caerostris extrusa TaxID=172846 RepID=A0AAV4MV82_CAEEX|nr:hypothetical protein CEXT_182541 [Caerostris extrusa]
MRENLQYRNIRGVGWKPETVESTRRKENTGLDKKPEPACGYPTKYPTGLEVEHRHFGKDLTSPKSFHGTKSCFLTIHWKSAWCFWLPKTHPVIETTRLKNLMQLRRQHQVRIINIAESALNSKFGSIPEEGNRKFNCWIRHELFIGRSSATEYSPSRENTLNGSLQTKPYCIRLQCKPFSFAGRRGIADVL